LPAHVGCRVNLRCDRIDSVVGISLF